MIILAWRSIFGCKTLLIPLLSDFITWTISEKMSTGKWSFTPSMMRISRCVFDFVIRSNKLRADILKNRYESY